MKPKYYIAILSVILISCMGLINRNSIKVNVDEYIDISQIKIEHGISAASINRDNDEVILKNRNGYEAIFENQTVRKIKNEYGENDFLITYKDSFYFVFRQFKTNWRHHHSYNFNFKLKSNYPFVQVHINGIDNMEFSSSMGPIKDSYKYLGNSLRSNFYLSTQDCCNNLNSYNLDTTKFLTFDQKLYKNIEDKSIHILTCDSDGYMYLRKLSIIIDIESAKEVGEFWIDKDFVYGKYETSDGKMLYTIEQADLLTFQPFLGSIYAKDKNSIHDTRHGEIKLADAKTFWPIRSKHENGISVRGKDKNNHFFWDNIIRDSKSSKKQSKKN